MEVLIKIILAIFETLFYTFLMVEVGSLNISNQIVSLLIHFISLSVISLLLYFIIHFILKKLNLKAKKHLYHICIYNIVVGLIFPIILIIIIPNKKFEIFAGIMLVSTLYYGIFINILIALFNHFLTNRRIS